MSCPLSKIQQPRVVAIAAGAAAAAAVLSYLALRALKPRRSRRLAVSDLFVYPLKSSSEIRVSKERALKSGFERDRLFQVTDAKDKFVTPRDSLGKSAVYPDCAKLFQVRCDVDLGKSLVLSKPGAPTLIVDLSSKAKEVEAKILGEKRLNDNKESMLDYGDAAAKWLESGIGVKGARLHGIGPKYQRQVMKNPNQGDEPISNAPINLGDEAPYLLTTTASLSDLRRRLLRKCKFGMAYRVDMRRFRPNIVVRGTLPWEEDTWKRIRIGKVEFQVWQRCGRCLMTTIDRDSLTRDTTLQELRTFRERGNQSNFGMHLVPISGCPADISEDDEVEVLEVDSQREQEWRRIFGS